MTSVLDSAAPALCVGSSGVSLEFERGLHEKSGVTPSRFSTSWNIHPQVPGSLASSKSIPQYLEPTWRQFSAWVLSVRSRWTGDCLKKKAIDSRLSPRVVPSLQFLLAPRCSRLCLQTMFLKYFVQNLYLLLVGRFFSDTSYSVLSKSQNSTSECF